MPDISPQDIVNEIQKFVDRFAAKIEPVQQRLYAKVMAVLKDVSVDSEGNIKRTSANMKLIKSVEKDLKSIIQNQEYQQNIADLKKYLDETIKLQQEYFKATDDAGKPSVMGEIQDQAFRSTVDVLTGAGIQSNLVNAATDIVSQGITEGASFADMNDQLRKFMVGDNETNGKLLSYSKQIVSDTLHTTSRNYNSIMTEKLGMEWFQYVGATVKDSRPWCKALVKKRWIHESELGSICRGVIDGTQVSRQGLMPDTNKSNVISRCGGWNCSHSMVPVPSELVPKAIRERFEPIEV